MAEISTIARPYAEAAFRVARAGDLNAWGEIIDALALVASDANMQNIIDDPNFTSDQLYGIFVAALKRDISTPVQNFLRALIENNRVALLPEIAAQFRVLKNTAEGSAEAQINSAYALSDAQIAELVAVLEKKFNKKLKPIVSVDQDLIGGVRVLVGDQVFDTSVRSRLDQMRTALAA